MKLKVGDGYLPIVRAYLQESFASDVSLFVAESYAAVADAATLEYNNVLLPLMVYSVQAVGNQMWRTTFVPKEWVEAMNKVIDPITGDFSHKQVLETAGFDKYLLPKEDKTQYWELPKMKAPRWLQFFYNRISAKAALATFSILGGPYIVDIQESLKEEGDIVTAQVVEDKLTTDWMSRAPMHILHQVDTMKPVEDVDIEILKDLGEGYDYRLVTVDKLKYLPQQMIESKLRVKALTSRQLKVKGVNWNPVLGAPYMFDKTKFVCIEYKQYENQCEAIMAAPAIKI